MINHNFKKKYGQNFITDINLLNAIVKDAQITANDDVLEIGAGAGTLTEVLSNTAKKVVSYEIDSDLQNTLLSLNLQNTRFVFKDIMKEPLEKIEEDFVGEYKMVANLPYYITTPIIFKFLNNSNKLDSLTIMVQKEVAQRMIAKSGDDDYGVLSIMIEFYGQASITRIVSRKMFYPQPNVDSAIVHLQIEQNKYPDIDKDKFYKFIQICFSMRRKTLKNNLSHGYGFSSNMLEEKLGKEILEKRAENFDIDQLINIFKNLF